MRLSISEARRRLPELVRQVKRDPGTVVHIAVRGNVVAELRAPLPEPEPGATARALLGLMRKLPRARGPRTGVSGHVKDYLYARRGPVTRRSPPRAGGAQEGGGGA